MKIQPHHYQTRLRYRKLSTYYSEHVLAGDKFCCRHYAACRASYTSEAGRFSAGQLNAPGTHYDLTGDGRPLRVVIVGQESGTGVSHTSMRRRRAAVKRTAMAQRFVAEDGYGARSQHMKGITSALRLLLGNGMGTDHDGEYVTLVDGTQVHLLHCFALVNYLLCSAHSTRRSKRGESTVTMRRNCNTHFRATLEILEPTVILVGGKAIWPQVKRTFDALTPVGEPIFKAQINGNDALVASFAHPSAMHPHNWGINTEMPYLQETVVPAIAMIRNLIWG